MKRVLFWGVIFLLLALDWAALHDILKGEPETNGEYGIIALSLVVFSLIIVRQLKWKV